MKKFMLWILAAACVLVSVEAGFAAYDWRYADYNYGKAKRTKAEAFFRKCDILVKDVRALAKKIVAYNKPAFETKLSKKEQYSGGFIIWNRVWAKDKTIVFGSAGKDKKFKVIRLITANPDFIFSGGIRVGASTEVLERFFADTMNNMGIIKGKTVIVNGPHWETTNFNSVIQVSCVNGIITEIMFNRDYGFSLVENSIYYDISKGALDFANKQARQLGLSELK